MTSSTAIQRARNGSADGLGELFQECRQYLLLVANQELGADLEAKMGGSDLVQETFLRAQMRFTSFKGSSDAELLAWLRTILLHHLSSTRRRYTTAEKRRVSREFSLDNNYKFIRDQTISKAPSPSRHAIECEEERALNVALQQLSDRHRMVIELRHREHLSFEDVARRLEMTSAAARQLWARAIKRLQSEVKVCRASDS